MHIYHITTSNEWEKAKLSSEYESANYPVDGFVHCSKKEQLLQVAERFYSGMNDLIVLEIDPVKCPAKIVEENLEGGSELFPHIYGKIPTSAVTRILRLVSEKGHFTVPGLV